MEIMDDKKPDIRLSMFQEVDPAKVLSADFVNDNIPFAPIDMRVECADDCAHYIRQMWKFARINEDTMLELMEDWIKRNSNRTRGYSLIESLVRTGEFRYLHDDELVYMITAWLSKSPDPWTRFSGMMRRMQELYAMNDMPFPAEIAITPKIETIAREKVQKYRWDLEEHIRGTAENCRRERDNGDTFSSG
jgi:hypothetical protein